MPQRPLNIANYRQLLDRSDAAEYLTSSLGRRVTAEQLAKLASAETGPPYTIFLGRAVYKPSTLDSWVAQILAKANAFPRRVSQRKSA